MGCIGVAHVFPLGGNSIGLMFSKTLSFFPDLSCVLFLLSFLGILFHVTM